MEREFYTGRWWVWVIQALSYIGILYLYFTVEGNELAYAIYIPLDFCIFVSMSCFFIFYYFQEKKKQRLDLALQNIIKKKFAQGLLRRMSHSEPVDKEVMEYRKSMTQVKMETDEDKKFSKTLYEED